MVRILNLTEWPRRPRVDRELPFRRFESGPLPVPAGQVGSCPILVEIGAATTAPFGPQARVFSQACGVTSRVRWQGPPTWLLGPASRSSRAPDKLRGDRASASSISSALAQNIRASKPLRYCPRQPLPGFLFDAATRSLEGEHNYGLLSRPLLGLAKDQGVRPDPQQPRHRPSSGARRQRSVAGRSGPSPGWGECRRREVGHPGGPRPETGRATSSSGQVGRAHPGRPGLARRRSAAMVEHAP